MVSPENPAQALQTRLDMLADCADHGVLLMPTHFVAPYCCHVERDAGKPQQPAFRGRWHGYSDN